MKTFEKDLHIQFSNCIIKLIPCLTSVYMSLNIDVM